MSFSPATRGPTSVNSYIIYNITYIDITTYIKMVFLLNKTIKYKEGFQTGLHAGRSRETTERERENERERERRKKRENETRENERER